MKYVVGILMVSSIATFASAEILSVNKNSVEISDSSNPYVAQVILVVPRH